MIQWFLSVTHLIRALAEKASNAITLHELGKNDDCVAIKGYMQSDYKQLLALWRQKVPGEHLGDLNRHIHFGMDSDCHDIINRDLPEIEKRAEELLLATEKEKDRHTIGFENLLHPIIVDQSYELYRHQHLREAVLNSVIAIYDFIRKKTGSKQDGDLLIGQVMSLQNPKLVLSDIDSESGRNDQKGFMQIYKGAFQGIRNPNAHSLAHDLTPIAAAQYLVFSSLLARRIEEATIVE